MIETELGPIDYVESGEGPTVLFVPGSYSTPAAWRAIQKRLPQRYRFVATSICGYGATTETRSLDDLGMQHQTRVVEAAVAHAGGGPMHLVGHSFGATICLATALAGRVDVRSIATFEANPLELTRERSGEAMYQDIRRMSDAFEAAHLSGEADAAGHIIDFWGAEGDFAAMPAPVRDYCRQTTWANALDWRTAYAFKARSADYAGLAMPVLLVRGGDCNPAMRVITDALSEALPDVSPHVIEGSGHFQISTHPDQCAELLAGHLDRVT